ncbi:MAG: pseudouridine synthase [Casimicrobiaceae bacterium]
MHKVLASCGFGSRRHMEEMILAGRITVNREPAEVGQKVGPGDEVRINGELVKVRFAEPRARILMYHKPTGEIVTRDDPEGRPTVFEKLPSIGNGKWIAIGRLDFNTEGLLLFTNSGELANRMMHPRYEVEREYAVRLMGTLGAEHKQALLAGITLDDGPAKVDKLEEGGGGEGSNHWYHVVLKEGRNREVRRLFESLGLTVSRLIRTRYGPVAMPSKVKRGQTLELTAEEVGAVMASAGLKTVPSPQPGRGNGKAKGGQPRPAGAKGQVHARGPRQGNGGVPHERNGNVEAGPRPAGAGQRPSGHGNNQRRAGGGGPGRPAGAPSGQGFAQRPGRQGGPGMPRRGPNEGHRGEGPVARTTLTIPGAIPEGLPGTSGPPLKSQSHGQGHGQGHVRSPGAGKPHRQKGPREQRAPRNDDDNRGNRAAPGPAPVLADEDFNR